MRRATEITLGVLVPVAVSEAAGLRINAPAPMGLSTVATGGALSLFDPQLGADLERQLAAGGGDS